MVAWPFATLFIISIVRTVSAFLSRGTAPTERILSPWASPCDLNIWETLSPSASRIFDCLAPSAFNIFDCLEPSASRMAAFFWPSAISIAALRFLSADVCSSIAPFTVPTGSTSRISTASTFTPQASVEWSRISRSFVFMKSRL